MLNENISWALIEGYLLQLSEGPVGGSKNYMPIQLLVMYLVAGGNPVTKMSPAKFLQIAKAYPVAVDHIVGDKSNLDTIQIPTITLADKDLLGDKWLQVPEQSKEKIKEIYNDVVNIIGN